MFWDILVDLCVSRGTTPTAVVSKLGISVGSITRWKSGSVPRSSALYKLSDYFGVTPNYLLGEEEPPVLTGDVNMFWQRFYVLCKQANSTPNAIAKKLSISSGAVTAWKNGRVPNGTTLQLIADYFGVTTDYLLGKENPPQPFLTSKGAELVRRMQELDDDQAEQLLQYMEFLLQQRKKRDD